MAGRTGPTSRLGAGAGGEMRLDYRTHHHHQNGNTRRPPGSLPAQAVLVAIAICTARVDLANAQYTEKLEAWSATSAATWQTKSLSGAPFSVPANAVVEIAIRNTNTSNSRFGGVRAVGSALERRFDLHEAAGGGVDSVTMHVQTDSGSQIEHYAETTTDVDFVLIGYWACGTYVERFDLFNSTSTWTDLDLNSYGVAAGGVAEVVMVNEHPTQFYSAGVRTNGSSLERRVNIHSSIDGFDAVSMIVKADNSASATIEAYAGHSGQLDFRLVGYWSVAPGSYTERFSDMGSPSSSATWGDVDLTSLGVSDGEVAEILFANDTATEENQMGVRANGSSVARLLNSTATATSGGCMSSRTVGRSSSSIIKISPTPIASI